MELNKIKESIITRARIGWNTARWLGFRASRSQLELADEIQEEPGAEVIGFRQIKPMGGRSQQESDRINWLLEAAIEGRPPIDPAMRQDMLDLGVDPERINRFRRAQAIRGQISRSHD